MTINIKLILTNEDVEGLHESGSYKYLFKAEPNGIDSDISVIVEKADPRTIDLPMSEAMQITTTKD